VAPLCVVAQDGGLTSFRKNLLRKNLRFDDELKLESAARDLAGK
jgi:hypothetical protein